MALCVGTGSTVPSASCWSGPQQSVAQWSMVWTGAAGGGGSSRRGALGRRPREGRLWKAGGSRLAPRVGGAAGYLTQGHSDKRGSLTPHAGFLESEGPQATVTVHRCGLSLETSVASAVKRHARGRPPRFAAQSSQAGAAPSRWLATRSLIAPWAWAHHGKGSGPLGRPSTPRPQTHRPPVFPPPPPAGGRSKIRPSSGHIHYTTGELPPSMLMAMPVR